MPDDELARRYLPMARAIAWKASRRYGLPYDVALSDAIWGLAKAIKQCTPGRPFEPYARSLIIGEILHGIRDRFGQRAAYENGRTLIQIVPLEDTDSRTDAIASDHAEAVIRKIDLWAAVKQLPDQEQQMITLRYLSDLTQQEIAARLDCSQMSVSRGLARARSRLRHTIKL